ncbi:acyl-CoA dehydrogenase family protein [Rhodococcus ruber]|nr:acyl-CoA dehydrogenase family protein [Rhodococcus ruber]MDO2378569.1 acyl-CoA dehydrogenase family protein [Rhodococcus ruber]AWH00921.1 acyl-CoA dehydrogenase [Rhodococcus ruber]MBD8056997.1 flavin-dependent monooxygenase [Rhodococcus ruber]MCD2129355.1 flavin-dependent monooxygenase [Rhodococcus ruber]MCZ4505810.1 acyl-CoA dehydrogenase family protein [Rhodococcus ruber]
METTMAIRSTMNPVRAATAGPAREKAFEDALAVLRDRRDEFNRQRFVPRDFVALLKRAGLYRASTPAQFGGEPMAPASFMKQVERISAVDPATGWVASFGSSLVYFAALPVETQEKIYSDGPDVAYAGGLFPMQKAEKVDGGYLCSGLWQFASGCLGADILGIGLAGGPETNGKPLTALVDPADVEIVENWDVAGMKATGSHAVKADRLFVPEEMTFVRGGAPRIDEPLTRYPTLAYAAQVLAVVTLGAARGALDYAHEVGAVRSSITGGDSKGNRPAYKTGLARAEADLRSARAFFYEITDEVWGLAVRGDEITAEHTALLRLGATQAAHVGRNVVLAAFDLAGTGAIYESHPLQRYLRDALVPAQHAMLQTNTFEAAGAVLLGLDPGIPSFP